jgi:hypothetical protein
MSEPFSNINLLCDHWIEESKWFSFHDGESISYVISNIIRNLETFYNLKDDHLPWKEIDADLAFQELIDCLEGSCFSQECTNILAIFCLDRGLFFCQMGGLKKRAYEEYLLSAVVSSMRLSE